GGSSKRDLGGLVGWAKARFFSAPCPPHDGGHGAPWCTPTTARLIMAPLPTLRARVFIRLFPRLANERRRHDLSGNGHVPDLRLLRIEVRSKQRLDLTNFFYGRAAQTEAAGDRGKIGATELDFAVGKPIHAKLVDLGAVSAVVQRHDQHLEAMARDRFQ